MSTGRNRGPAVLMPQPYPKVPCSTYGCLHRATVSIGKPDGPKNLRTHLCDECMQSIVSSGVEQGLIKLEGIATSPPSILGGNVRQIAAALTEISNIEELRALRSMEEVGKTRSTVTSAIDARIAEIEDSLEAGSEAGEEVAGDGGETPAEGEPVE